MIIQQIAAAAALAAAQPAPVAAAPAAAEQAAPAAAAPESGAARRARAGFSAIAPSGERGIDPTWAVAGDGYFEAMLRQAGGAASVATDDPPERVRQRAMADLSDERFFNRPGATRLQYESEWEQCRLIARNLAAQRPGMVAMPAAVHGGLVGALVGAGIDAIADGDWRRGLRRECLIARGWRMVEPHQEWRRRIDAMRQPERSVYLDSMIGAQTLDGSSNVTDLGRLIAQGPRWVPALLTEQPAAQVPRGRAVTVSELMRGEAAEAAQPQPQPN